MMKLGKCDYILIIFISLVAATSLYLSFNTSLSPDEGTHLILSEFLRDLILSIPRTGLNFGKIYQFGIDYLIHYPKLTITYLPMYHLNVALLFTLWLNPVSGRFVSIIYFALSSVMIYLIAMEVFKNKKIGLTAVMLFSLAPTVFSSISQASMDFTAYFFGFLTMYLFMKSLNTQKTYYYISSGISSFLFFFSRIFAIFPVVAMPLYIMLFEKKNKLKKILIIAIPFLLLFVPFMAFYQKIGGLEVSSIIIKEAEQVPWARYDLLTPFYYFYYFTIQTYGIGIAVFIAAFLYLYKSMKTKENVKASTFFILLALVTYLVVTYFMNPRYVSYLLMPLIFPAAYYFSKIKLAYLVVFIVTLSIISGWNSCMAVLDSRPFINTEKEISKYLYEKGGNVGLTSEEPVYSSAFIFYISTLDANKTDIVYRPCFFTDFINKSKDTLISEMSKNGISSVLAVKGSKNYGIIESIKENLSLDRTFYAGNYSFEVYSTNFKSGQQQICNYICVTGYYLCTNHTSPFTSQ